jgi:hypothetical protein
MHQVYELNILLFMRTQCWPNTIQIVFGCHNGRYDTAEWFTWRTLRMPMNVIDSGIHALYCYVYISALTILTMMIPAFFFDVEVDYIIVVTISIVYVLPLSNRATPAPS